MSTSTVDARAAAEHGLTSDEYRRLREVLGREPNLPELGVFSVMWSEHCSYKSSRAVLRGLPSDGPEVLQGPGENAGAVAIGDGLAAVFKIESHNHPSFVEPFQGAATGVGGILRDVFTMGARPVANLNSLRFGDFNDDRTRYLLSGVVAGIGGYGNCVGVPTVGGEIYFDEAYNENILVNAFTLGIVRADRIFRASATGVGNPVLYVGSRTGRDGIHGASLLASAEFDETTDAKRPTVQVGDPFTEKLLIEACLELMARDAIVAIQDMGAAGLTSSSVEMAARGGTGLAIDLDLVPLRDQSLTPYEILLSESQERMLIVARAGAEGDVGAVFAKWDLEAVVIGEVTEDGRFRVRSRGEEVVNIPVAALTDEAPCYRREAVPEKDWEKRHGMTLRSIRMPVDYDAVLLRLLDSPNIASKRWAFRQYDSLVGGNTVVPPGSDAAVVMVEGSDKGLALSVDGNSRYCLLDPYVGGMIAVAEATRNVVCSGARPIGGTDCLNFGNPEKPEIMWQFKEVVRGITDACVALKLPIVGGNVSFYNETEGRPIPPTPTIAVVGLIDDVKTRVTQWFRREGDIVVQLGVTREELGGSEYLAVEREMVAGNPPWVDLELEVRLQRICLQAIALGWVHSAHDIAEGGLAVALAECCMTGPLRLGAVIDLSEEMRADAGLFGESQARILLTIDRKNMDGLRSLARGAGVPLTTLGEIRGANLRIGSLIDLPVAELYRAWSNAIPRRLGVAADGSSLQ